MTELAENMQTNRRGQSQHVGNLGSLTKTGIPPLDAITSTVEWQLLNVLKPAEFTPDLLIIDEFNKCANRLILRFVDLFFFYWDGFV